MQHGNIGKTSLDAGGGAEVLESTLGRQRSEPEYHIGSFPACWPAHPCDQRHRIGAGPTKHEVGNNSLYGDLPDIRQGLQRQKCVCSLW